MEFAEVHTPKPVEEKAVDVAVLSGARINDKIRLRVFITENGQLQC